ncbi:hypothetical protein NDU88_005337 [Pleurodeles waltl]|uniref:Uncharacterized protein n=1 Tax=Pleurodeles waltl TaxID=8319 RepID=A0AAV7SLB7_PLEWA|nr:hypothetical protein NDU88_005337 [Pleurodeles waltl]
MARVSQTSCRVKELCETKVRRSHGEESLTDRRWPDRGLERPEAGSFNFMAADPEPPAWAEDESGAGATASGGGAGEDATEVSLSGGSKRGLEDPAPQRLIQATVTVQHWAL